MAGCTCTAEDTGGPHWNYCPLAEPPKLLRLYTIRSTYDEECQGRIEEHAGFGIVCEACQEHVDVYAHTWTQGVRGTDPSEPDTMSAKECLKCFLTYPDQASIEWDK